MRFTGGAQPHVLPARSSTQGAASALHGAPLCCLSTSAAAAPGSHGCVGCERQQPAITGCCSFRVGWLHGVSLTLTLAASSRSALGSAAPQLQAHGVLQDAAARVHRQLDDRAQHHAAQQPLLRVRLRRRARRGLFRG